MGNFFNNGPKKIEINCQSSYISYIDIHLGKKHVDLKTGFFKNVFLNIYRCQTDHNDNRI